MHELRFGVSYDFRNPPDSGVPDPVFYQEILEQVRWLDSIGADLVWFTEHHFVSPKTWPCWTTSPTAGSRSAWEWDTPLMSSVASVFRRAGGYRS